MNLEERLKVAREEARISQEKLGELIGVTKQTIQRYEKNAGGIPLNKLIKIGEVTQVSLNWLIHGDQKVVTKNEKIALLAQKIERVDKETLEEIIKIAEAIMLRSLSKAMII